MIHKWQRWSSAHSVIGAYQKHCSIRSVSLPTALSAHSVALNGSVCELCREGMQKTRLEPICLGRFKGNFTTYWRHGHISFAGLCFHYLKWSVKSACVHESCDISRCRTWALVLTFVCLTSYWATLLESRKIINVDSSTPSMHRLPLLFFTS